jgi:hypothetical protein
MSGCFPARIFTIQTASASGFISKRLASLVSLQPLKIIVSAQPYFYHDTILAEGTSEAFVCRYYFVIALKLIRDFASMHTFLL